MTTNALYCSKCRGNYAQHIANYKFGPEKFRQVIVTDRNSNGTYKCRCEECGHTWKSKSPEAEALFKAATRAT